MASVLRPSKRRWKPVRLADVPVKERRRAAKQVIAQETDARMCLEVFLLAEWPGNTTAWIAE